MIEPDDKVKLDKQGAYEYEGEVLEVKQNDVLVAWETGDESWYHSYELEVQR